jgi:hypothetical protein
MLFSLFKKPLNFIVFILFFVISCKNEEPGKTFIVDEGNASFTFSDTEVISFSDVNNFMIGFSAEDPESLDTLFSEIILKNVKSGRFTNITDAEGKAITTAEAVAFLEQEKTILSEDPDDPEYHETIVSKGMVTASDIVQIASKNSWYWDDENLRLKIKISALAPVVYTYDSDGDVRGKKILFWIILE